MNPNDQQFQNQTPQPINPTPTPTPMPTPMNVPPKPPMPPVQNSKPNMMNPSGSKSVTPIILAFVVLLIIGGYMYIMWHNNPSVLTPSTTTSLTTPTTPKVEPTLVTRTDLQNAKTDADKLPVGFPKDIPVEYKNISESVSILYPAKLATLDSVSYTSLKSPKEKYTEYVSFLSVAQNKFSVLKKTPTTATSTTAMLQASRFPTEISIVITPQGTGSLVQIALTVHQ
jgi:hypothetical protein